MLKQWYSPSALSFLMKEMPVEVDDVVLWDTPKDRDDEDTVVTTLSRANSVICRDYWRDLTMFTTASQGEHEVRNAASTQERHH